MKIEKQSLSSNAENPANYFSLVAVDLATMEENIVYQWSQSAKWFFGVLDKESSGASPNQVGIFFIHNSQLYYLYNTELYVMDLRTGRYELFMDLPNSPAGLSYDGANIYYTDQYNRLNIHNLKTDQIQSIEEVVARRFVCAPDGIYFLNFRDNNSLYYWDETVQAAQKLDNTGAYGLYWDESYCWIDTMEGLYRLNHDGSGKTKVECPGYVCCITIGSTMYMMDYIDEILYSVNKDTLEWKRIEQ